MTDRTVETMAREAAQMARARFDDPVRRFPPHYINGFCDGVRDGFKEGHASRDEEVKALREERDRAIAHDTQPYPTAWAYEQACKALVSSDAEIAALRQRVAEANEVIVHFTRMIGDRILDRECHTLLLDSEMTNAIIQAHNKESNV